VFSHERGTPGPLYQTFRVGTCRASEYRGTSLIRKRPPNWDSARTIGIEAIGRASRGVRFLS
jgi:hypothetical protein